VFIGWFIVISWPGNWLSHKNFNDNAYSENGEGNGYDTGGNG